MIKENQFRSESDTKKPKRSKRKFRLPFRKQQEFSITNFIVFLTLLGILYIANDYYTKELLGAIDTESANLQRTKERYHRVRYAFDLEMKKDRIAQRVRGLGLEESNKPVYQIQIEAE